MTDEEQEDQESLDEQERALQELVNWPDVAENHAEN